MSHNDMASWITAPQYAVYKDCPNPNIIPRMSTIERRNVLRMGFAVGQSRTFIYQRKRNYKG